MSYMWNCGVSAAPSVMTQGFLRRRKLGQRMQQGRVYLSRPG